MRRPPTILTEHPDPPGRSILSRLNVVRSRPTAPIAAGVFVLSYGVVAITGSRPLGGVVLAVGGLCCVQMWSRRHGPRTAAELACVGLGAFVLSHVLALAIGAWPSVLLLAAASATVVWRRADSRPPASARGLAFRPRAQ
jgi:hypothetical protein